MLIKIIRQKRSTKNRVILLYISASVATTTRREPGWNLKLQDYWSAIIFNKDQNGAIAPPKLRKKIASKTQTIGKNVKNSIIVLLLYNITAKGAYVRLM